MIGKMIQRWRRSAVQDFPRDQRGVAAVEFGLVAPLLFFSLLSMADVGFAVRDRIQLDHFMRAGAQAAMRDAGEALVLATLRRTGCESNEVYPNCSGLQGIEFTPPPDRFCVCPITGEEDTNCTATCGVRPLKFYRISAAKTYDGIFLPQIALAPSILVEVR